MLSSKDRIRIRRRLVLQQRELCIWCGNPMIEVSLNQLPKEMTRARSMVATLEHIVPKREGGSDKPINLAAACVTCNVLRNECALTPDPTVLKLLSRQQQEYITKHTQCDTLFLETKIPVSDEKDRYTEMVLGTSVYEKNKLRVVKSKQQWEKDLEGIRKKSP